MRFFFIVKIVLPVLIICGISQFPYTLASASFSENAMDAQTSVVTFDDILNETKEDSTTLKYLETDFKERIPTFDEIQLLNSTVFQDIEITNQIPPLIPTRDSPEILSSKNKQTSEFVIDESLQTTGYFDGHIWSSEYGPHDQDTRAVPITPAMEGHWFPKSTYSRISYQALIQPGMKAHIRVERELDTASRYFRVYVGYTQVLNTLISSSQSYWEGDVALLNTGWLTITLEIYGGGASEKGWKLKYYHLFDSSNQPYDTTEENFQNALYSELRYITPMGPNTELDIQCVNIHDPFYRYLYVYIDGQLWSTLIAPGSYHIQLPSYSTPGLHEIKFVLYYGNFGTNPKALTHWWVNYEYKKIEVDWMVGQGYNHQQSSSVFDYLEAYWIIHDYRRVTFIEDTSVSFDNDISWEQFLLFYRDVYFNHLGQTRWTYGLFAHYIDPNYIWGYGSRTNGFLIADEHSDYLFYSRIWILMHEYGHVEGMQDGSGGVPDIYGTNRILSYHYYHCSSWDQYLSRARGIW